MSEDKTEEPTSPGDVATKMANFAAQLLSHSEAFSEASRTIRSLHGVALSAYLLEQAVKVGVTTEKLHDFRRWMTDVAREARR